MTCFCCCEPWILYGIQGSFWRLISSNYRQWLSNRKFKPNFGIQYSMSVVHLLETFYIFVVLSSQHTYWWKCFHNIENVVVFKEERAKWTALISCLDKASYTLIGITVCHIYTSVGYWVSFVFFRVLPQPSISQVKSAPRLSRQ